MYEKINPVSDLKDSALTFVIKNDRFFYNEFLSEMEKYCIENGIIIGGHTGIEILLGLPISHTSYSYELYTDDTFDHARKIADAMFNTRAKYINKETIAVETNLKHRLFTIWINARPIIKVHNLSKYRNVQLSKLINPMTAKARFADGKILCMSAEVQLIQIYQNLYNPHPPTTDYLKYDELLDIEQQLFDSIELAKRAQKKAKGGNSKPIVGGASLADIISSIIADILKNSDNILIGDYAIEYLTGVRQKIKRLQFLSSVPAEELRDIIQKMPVTGNKIKINFVRYDLHIPTDFQLNKYTFYMNIDDKQTPLFDMFDSPTYELIPYKQVDEFKISGIFVILRFKFIDLYATRLILSIGTANEKFMREKIAEIVAQIRSIREKSREFVKEDPFAVFQLDNYIGIFVPENIVRKKIMRQQTERFTKYYPALKFGRPTGADTPIKGTPL